jgi:CheY-like chemotaxis protein
MSTERKRSILVVEDDSLFLWTLEHFLKQEGYDVCPATTAELALEMAQRRSFDVVISDYHLPGLNGREMIEQLKLLSPCTKAVLISAYQKEETGSNDGRLLNAYLNKPIELGSLKKVLQDLTTPLIEAVRS